MTMPNSLRTRARRAWPVRHLWRPLRRRDPDAADPGARAGLRGGQARPRLPTPSCEGWFKDYVGRPSPLYFAERLTEHLGGAKIYFKRDELNHTGAHKINNCSARSCWPGAWARQRIIAETGAGQHGVATATVAARFGLRCIVYMGERDIERQQPNVFRMQLLGAEVRPVTLGLAHAQGRDERGAARLGQQRRTTPSTSSARWRGRTPIRPWCATSSR